MRPDGGELLRSEALDFLQVLESREFSVCFPEGDNGLRHFRAHAGQDVQFLCPGGIDVDGDGDIDLVFGQGDWLTGHLQKVNDIGWSPDGQWLASASDDGTVGLWDIFRN